jgi:hypothetical protein
MLTYITQTAQSRCKWLRPGFGCNAIAGQLVIGANMELILIIVVLVLLFGGGGGYWGRSRGYW